MIKIGVAAGNCGKPSSLWVHRQGVSCCVLSRQDSRYWAQVLTLHNSFRPRLGSDLAQRWIHRADDLGTCRSWPPSGKANVLKHREQVTKNKWEGKWRVEASRPATNHLEQLWTEWPSDVEPTQGPSLLIIIQPEKTETALTNQDGVSLSLWAISERKWE